MTKIVGMDSEVYWGKDNEDAPENWRDDEELMNEEDPDDEDLPAESWLVDLLGFNPDEVWADDEDKKE